MKRILFRLAVPMFCFILTGANAVHALDMTEGEWEIVSETSMTMGGMSMPSIATKATYCLTREEPCPSVEKEKDCKVVDQRISGNKVSWRIVCKDAEGDGEITYGGTTYKGTFRLRTTEGGEAPKKGTAKSRQKKAAGEDEGGETMTMTMKLSGRYLGPCPAGQKSGPTGETAKQVAKGQQAAAQAKQQQAQMLAEQEAIAKKTEAFMKRAVVPAEERGACAQKGCSRTPCTSAVTWSLRISD